jgi:3-hydroxyisobutyrate dehydrogenase
VTQVASLKEALSGADAVVLSVSDTPDVEELLLGVDGAISTLAAGAVVIDTSTIAPSATRRMGEQLATKGILMVDAPVSGGSEGAVNGTLTVFLGGSAEAVAAAQPYLAAFAKTITHLGPLGAGQVGKSWVLENRWQRMAEDRYPLGFKVALHRKDLGIAIDLAKELGVSLPTATLVAQLEDALIAAGKGGEDLSALANQLRRMADSADA